VSLPSPRIPPVSGEDMTEEQRLLLNAPPPGTTGSWVGDLSSMNFTAVLAQHPELFKTLLPLIAKLSPGSNLPPRDRQILLLRTLELGGETYEAYHQVVIARNAGMTDSEIEAAATGRGGLSPFEQCLVRAAEELFQEQCVSSETWEALSERYSPVELMEVVALVGGWTLMAMMTKSYGIQLEDPDTFDSLNKRRLYT
jgi:4-carboxymuconolactone decarboxylase